MLLLLLLPLPRLAASDTSQAAQAGGGLGESPSYFTLSLP